ncbi:uncharacterized protein K452DRAFT_356327 [Aplosporella prunicola CBS 121167]|uniref:Uncharacterized protein n=1 Tax=Aplosporella prunicola CBS 121167 TaxID=1176127 RepID=A0A6A6BP30_9PEZI|nr:uncharacterized protein K452DRAFT_356327 [Aplosporella prunicola CBS 121167]KAF2144984.1 hypothetical protein K452DRAFT_356327 [Aplosporella prunicola CBS 121167]
MATEETFNAGDLRGASVDYQRDHEQKHKWALGQAWGPGRNMEAHGRPMRVGKHPGDRRDVDHNLSKSRKHRDIDTEQYLSGDSSTEEEPIEASAAPEPDADITYSYDAAQGPGHGSQILSQALVQAIERFEDRQTHELVKEEYEVLGPNGEPLTMGGKGKKSAGKAADDDEYEFV